MSVWLRYSAIKIILNDLFILSAQAMPVVSAMGGSPTYDKRLIEKFRDDLMPI